MPYFMDGNCVMKGTKEKPEGTVKCHKTRKDALAHMRALEVNVMNKEGKKSKSSLDGVPGRFDSVRINKERIVDETT